MILGIDIGGTKCAVIKARADGENIKLLIKRNRIDRAVYVGDTQGDCDATAFAGIPFVYAQYGFGNAENPDYTIHSFSEMAELAKKIFV